MTIGKKEMPPINPNTKVSVLRGLNNTTENISRQMMSADPYFKKKDLSDNSNKLMENRKMVNNVNVPRDLNSSVKSKYDPSKQREHLISMNILNKR